MNVLIVEDQEAMRAALCAYLLAAFPQVRLSEAAGVTQALTLALKQKPQLAIVDVLLPDGNGIDLTRVLKARVPGLQVVIVSYLNSQTYIDKARDAGAHAYIVKDRLFPDLRQAIIDALAAAGQRCPQ